MEETKGEPGGGPEKGAGMALLDSAEIIETHLVELRREFHRHPETSWNERETAERIVRELKLIGGIDIRPEVGGTHGVFAEITGTEPGKTVVLRADMDALTIREETNLSYASENPGVMHACGHDTHITMMLGAARLLQEYRDELRGTVRLVFQPAEENAPIGGSRTMIQNGALTGADAVFALHAWPNIPLGKLGVTNGPQMAASDHFFVKIKGRATHGAQPNQGVDALIAGAQFVNAVQTVISRNRDPLKAAVITIGVFRAGTRYNIVPGNCEMEGTCRSYDPEVRELCEKRIREVLNGICSALGCTGELIYERGYDAVINSPEMADYMRRTQEKLFGPGSAFVPEYPAMTAEDFSFYLKESPGAFGWIGTTPEGGEVNPLHSSRYAPDEDVLWRGAALLASLALDFEN